MAHMELRQVVKNYGALNVIRGVDLGINSGEFVVFVGPSGCGKSTLLRMIAGLESISGGELRIDDQRMNEVTASKRGIAMVFQSYALYPHMNVYKNMAFGLETAGMPKPQIDQRVRRAADILQIGPYLQRKPKALSGGQRQRVAIGRAIVREPKVFLFDEPLSNLDAELRVQMRVEIAKLHRDLGATMIYVTHDQVEAMTLADKIVVLRGGQIEQVGSPLEIYNRPANQFVAGFIGSPKMNFLKLGRRADGLDLAGSPIALPLPADAARAQSLTLGVRPEHVQVGEGAGLPLGIAAADHVEHLGSETIVYARLADGQVLTLSFEGQQSVRSGDTFVVSTTPALCHVFDETGKTVARCV